MTDSNTTQCLVIYCHNVWNAQNDKFHKPEKEAQQKQELQQQIKPQYDQQEYMDPSEWELYTQPMQTIINLNI